MGVTYDEMKESKDCGYDDEGYRPDFVPGVLVEREIEGMFFLAEITHTHMRGKEFTLRYVDDDNIEEGVSIDEIRLSRTSAMDSPRAERRGKNMRLKLLFIMTTSQVCENGIVLVGVYVFLSIGLVFVIVLHISHPLVFPDITDSSIIINGAEKTLAAGGGLRALRHLKNLKK
jgi:hypothetical protein